VRPLFPCSQCTPYTFRTPTGTPSGQRDLSGKATSSGPMPQVVPANMDTAAILSEDGGKACEGCLSKQAFHIWYDSILV